jgi:hypothetical protein
MSRSSGTWRRERGRVRFGGQQMWFRGAHGDVGGQLDGYTARAAALEHPA